MPAARTYHATQSIFFSPLYAHTMSPLQSAHPFRCIPDLYSLCTHYLSFVSWRTNTRLLSSAAALVRLDPLFCFFVSTELSLTVPIVNTLAFLFTVIGEWWVESKVISRGTFQPGVMLFPLPSRAFGLPTNCCPPIKTLASAWLCRCVGSPCVFIARRGKDVVDM